MWLACYHWGCHKPVCSKDLKGGGECCKILSPSTRSVLTHTVFVSLLFLKSQSQSKRHDPERPSSAALSLWSGKAANEGQNKRTACKQASHAVCTAPQPRPQMYSRDRNLNNYLFIHCMVIHNTCQYCYMYQYRYITVLQVLSQTNRPLYHTTYQVKFYECFVLHQVYNNEVHISADWLQWSDDYNN